MNGIEVYQQRGGEIILKFQKLTPTESVDLSAYEDGFQFIFENDDIRNVAISGPYSSGKSSLLESYKAKHEDKKFLHISLAHFSDENEIKIEENSSEDIEAVIEGKILNQLIQQISTKNIPQTNFRIKRKIGKVETLFWTIGCVLTITIILMLLNLNKFAAWINSYSDDKWIIPWLKPLLLHFTTPLGVIICTIILMVLVGGAIYRMLDIQRNKNFLKRVSVQGNEIEIFEDSKESYFDKYLNEVLYLFENSGVDVIVFEDIDRFENVRVFERLREINMLANIRLKQDKKHAVIRFFYLLRDDIFVTKDRAKFFDYIMPVVPVIDSSNSYDKIKEYFAGIECSVSLDDRFLKGLSLYIDDLRVLKNIYNEFVVYYERLKKVDLDPNKLLAMITYKNIFPRDFASLQLNKGFVFSLFAHKDDFVNEEISSLNGEIEKIKHRLELAKNELSESEQELEYVKKGRHNSSGYQYTETYRAYQKWEKEEYPVRLQALRDRSNEQNAELQKQLRNAERKIQRISGWGLSKIITRDNIDTIFQIVTKNDIGDEENYYDVKGSEYFDLLKFLIRYGYIDESYSDYMTYFYANSVSLNDKMFLRSVNDRRAKEYAYPLNSPVQVLANLVPADFLQEETLNYSLLNYLLTETNERKAACLKNLADQMVERKPYDFLAGFFDIDQHRREFVVWLNNAWPEYFSVSLKQHKLSDNLLWWYIRYSVSYCEEDILDKMNGANELTNYIDNQADFLKQTGLSKDKYINALTFLKIKFVKIHEDSDAELLKGIYSQNLYLINADNISVFLKTEYHVNFAESMHHILTTVSMQTEQCLYKYMFSQLDKSVQQAVDISENSIDDVPDTVVTVINSELVSQENGIKYIQALTTIIPVLKPVENKYYRDLLLQRRMVADTAENIIEYFAKQGLTDTLVNFINETDHAIPYNNFTDGVFESFMEAVISCEEIDDSHYEEIFSYCEKKYTQFNYTGISKSKIKILISLNVIIMNSQNLTFMRNNYPDDVFDYIRQNLKEYCNVAKSGYSKYEETAEILRWNIASDEDVIDLISCTGGSYSVIESTNSDRVILYILEHNFKDCDFLLLANKYANYISEIKDKIMQLALAREQVVCSNIKQFDKEFVLDLLRSASIHKNYKNSILVTLINEKKSEEIHEYLKVAGYDEVAKIFEENKRPKVMISEDHRILLEALKRNRMIVSYEPDEKSVAYRIKRIRKSSTPSMPTSLL